MKKYAKYFMLLLTMVLFACTPEESETPAPEDPEMEQEIENPTPESDTESQKEEVDENETAAFPNQIEETIEIEGMEEPLVLNLYENPDAEFLTYVPDDFVVEELDGVEGESYKFIVNYEGERNDAINVEIYLFGHQVTEEPTLEDADSAFAQRLQGMQEVSSEDEWFDWSLREYHTEDETVHAMLGEHEGEYFLVTMNSEPLYSEGFIPRANKIIEHFYWTDTNEYLMDNS